jgi:hypothetical protein
MESPKRRRETERLPIMETLRQIFDRLNPIGGINVCEGEYATVSAYDSMGAEAEITVANIDGIVRVFFNNQPMTVG